MRLYQLRWHIITDTQQAREAIPDLTDFLDEDALSSFVDCSNDPKIMLSAFYEAEKNPDEISDILRSKGFRLIDVKGEFIEGTDGLDDFYAFFEDAHDPNIPLLETKTFRVFRSAQYDVFPQNQPAQKDGKTDLHIYNPRAFGDGHHPTTALCIEALEKFARHVPQDHMPKRVLDVGIGSGILSLAAAKLWPEISVFGTDTEEDALDTAKLNWAQNGLYSDKLQVQHSSIPSFDGRFCLITANILKRPLLDLAPYLSAQQNKGDSLILSGFLSDQIGDIKAAYHKQNYHEVRTSEKDGWACLTVLKQ